MIKERKNIDFNVLWLMDLLSESDHVYDILKYIYFIVNES